MVVATEQFEKLAKVIMVKGNPEYIAQEELNRVCDQVVEDVLVRLTRVHAN